jgi:L-fuculokinase
LMTDLLLDELDVAGDVVVDGPLARNPLFGRLLATWRATDCISLSVGVGGYARAACYLADLLHAKHSAFSPADPLDMAGLRNYRVEWRELLQRGKSP